MSRWLAALVLPFFGVVAAVGQRADSCAALAKLTLPSTTVVRAALVRTGSFVAPPSPTGEAASAADTHLYQKLPAFCRVELRSAPTADSDIKIEVWLPATGWNGKFRGQGNGGFAGEIGYGMMGWALSQGYATAGTDTGHAGGSTDAAWALHHPEKVVDFGNRGIHVMTANAKAVIDAYYGKAPSRSYFASCSDGGREALMEAQRFPEDYDGILAGAPAYAWTNLLTAGMNKVKGLMLDKASYIPPEKIPAISSAVLAACDAADGVKDGILNDPRTCHFEPETLLCKGADSNSCLTAPQVAVVKMIYAPTVDSTGKQIYPGGTPGGELGPGGWATWVLGTEPGKSLGVAFGTGYFTNMVYSDPQWDWKTFTVDEGLKTAIEKTAPALNATDPDLKRFAARGGKLILYHGWNDPAISPLSTIEYYEQVTEANANAASFVRLFMVPGMQHCYGGPGPSSFGQFGWRPGTGPDDSDHDLSRALEEWVNEGTAPEQVIAAKIESDEKNGAKITMTRPLCAYPKAARYKGAGDTAEASSFVCE